MPTPLPGLPGTVGSNSPWGMVPQVSDPNAAANAAITGDLANLPGLQTLAGGINSFNTGQAIAPYVANLPGYSQMVGQSSQNIGSLLRGEVPQDVMGLLGQQAAERGVSTGLSGSPNENAAYLRNLGETSLGLQKQGETELSGAVARTPVPQLFNTASFLTTPGEQQAAQQAANIYAAAPNPNMQVQALLDLFQKFLTRTGGSGGVTYPAVGGGGGTGTSTYSGAGPTPGASGGGGMPVTVGPGRSINAGAIFNQPGSGSGATNLLGPSSQAPPWASIPGGENLWQSGWTPDNAGTGVISPDALAGAAGGSSQLNDFSSPAYQWWNQPDPYSAMSNIDWGSPTNWQNQPAVPPGLAQSTSPAYDWYNQPDPYSSLSDINWGQPTFQDQSGGGDYYDFAGP